MGNDEFISTVLPEIRTYIKEVLEKFVYPNLKLGGFGSSLYLSVDKGKTLFFIAKSSRDLVESLDSLYDSLFSDAKFYN